MKSSTRIDSVVFQLTPTRTRCDLLINANGKTEHIASGLLNPFLTHLKSAQEQIGKGAYSIILEPHHGSDSSWFTKGTVERFVRFVSTPEILERVYTIESEICQMLEAISFQSDNDMELHSQVHDHLIKQKESSEAASKRLNEYSSAKSGSNAVTASEEEKAIAIYKPDALETDQSNMHGENPKTQLMSVLETRKNVLEKEQGLAFAQAVAAGFDVDHVAPLMSFAECFGATRMMEACSRFMEIWEAKHESGQWVQVEAVPNASDKHVEFNESGLQSRYTYIDKSGLHYDRILKQRRHSMDNGELYNKSDVIQDIYASENRVCHSSDKEEDCQIQEVRKKKGGNNCSTSNRQHSSSRDSESSYASRHDDDETTMNADTYCLDNKDIRRRSNRDGNQKRYGYAFKQFDKVDNLSGHAEDDGDWQTFQNVLYRNADDGGNSGRSSMFVKEGKASGRKRDKPSKLIPAEDARARAERLRSFKADPQILIKAKEEEQIKRQKRIAARSSYGTPTKKLLPTKLLPASYKGSKFSDTDPVSSSPLQRSTLKTISRLSGDAQKVSRLGRLNFSSQSDSDRNNFNWSTSSSIELKEVKDGSLPGLKPSFSRIKRLSDPKGTSSLASSINPNEKSLSIRASKESEIKKTPHSTVKSEVIKSTALPESHIEESKGLSEVAHKKSSINEATHKMNMKSVCSASASQIGSSDRVSSQNDYDSVKVVEKTILMLQYEKPSPVRPASEKKILVQSLKTALDPTAEPACCAEKVLPNISTVELAEKPHNAPYARLSSLEDPCMEKSECGKAPLAVDTTTASSELTTVHVSSEQHKFDKMWEVSEKPMEKGSFKGLKQLLKFGRKRRNSIAGEFNLVPDVANHAGPIADYNASRGASSGDVASLKTLISQGEGPSAHSTAHKSSRSFSLLSSFWIKTSEKKLNK